MRLKEREYLMNTTQLACFLEVAEHLSFAKAAQNLHISQPTVSKQIRSLEDELGVRLFERSTRNVSLTYAGRRFFPDARGILIQERNAAQRLRDLEKTQQQPLIIGSYGMEFVSYLPQILSSLYREIPHLRSDIVSAPYQSLSSALSSHSIDIIIGIKEIVEARHHARGNFYMVEEAPLCCILSENGGIFSAGEKRRHEEEMKVADGRMTQGTESEERLSYDDLSPEKMKTRFGVTERLTFADLEAALRDRPELAGQKNIFGGENVIFCDSVEAVLCLVRAGAGYLLLPEPKPLRQNGLRYLTLENAPVFSYGYFYEKTNPNPALKKFRRLMREYFRSASE